tara:strand:+ start:352 stop:996 length:645 start_codon:yes stop_codon:yes gene_type:complete
MKIAELSGKPTSRDMATRTEGYSKNGQGQSIGIEITSPRGRDSLNKVEKVCRYLLETIGFRIKSLIQQMSLRQLRAANAPAPYNLVMSDKGIWGSKGMQGLLVDVAVTGSNSKPGSLLGEQGQEMLSRGFVTSIGGIDVYFSNEIEDDVSSGGDSASFMFSKGALGLAVGPEGLFRIETERNASFRSTEYVATGFWGEVETKDAFGVYILHDVS